MPEEPDKELLKELDNSAGKKFPAFLFYVHNWKSSTMLWDAEQKGWYIELLTHAWDQDPQATITSNDGKLKVIAGFCTQKELRDAAALQTHTFASERMERWQEVRDKFVPSDEYPTRLHNKKMTNVLKEARNLGKVRIRAARHAAEVRWQNTANKQVDAHRMPTHTVGNAQAMPEQSGSNADGMRTVCAEMPNLNLKGSKEKSTLSESNNLNKSTVKSKDDRKKPRTLFDPKKFDLTDGTKIYIAEHYDDFDIGDVKFLVRKFCNVFDGKSYSNWNSTFRNFIDNETTKYGYVAGQYKRQKPQQNGNQAGDATIALLERITKELETDDGTESETVSSSSSKALHPSTALRLTADNEE